MWRAVADELHGAATGGVLAGDSVTGALLVPEPLRPSCELRVADRPAFRSTGRDALAEALDHHLWRLRDAAGRPALAGRTPGVPTG